MAAHVNINNLNVLTFIKDIYSSLKYIDNNFNIIKENINSRLTILEDNQKTILNKLELFETLLTKLNETTKETITLDKTLENQLLNKLSSLNETGIESKLELKPNELTFENVLENNYSFSDIDSSIKQSNNDLTNDNNLLIFSISSDSSLATLSSNSHDNYDTDNVLISQKNINDTEITNIKSNLDTTKKETLENLLF